MLRSPTKRESNFFSTKDSHGLNLHNWLVDHHIIPAASPPFIKYKRVFDEPANYYLTDPFASKPYLQYKSLPRTSKSHIPTNWSKPWKKAWPSSS
jgi:hypothetical protein